MIEKKYFYCLICFVCLLISCGENYEEKDGKIYHKFHHGGKMKYVYTLLPEADPKTFTIIKEDISGDLAKDHQHVYYNSEIIPSADPKTFQPIGKYYWKDKNNVYFLNYLWEHEFMVPKANPNSFKALEDGYGKDAQRVFKGRKWIPQANPISFEVINKHWSRDATHYFSGEKRIDSLDYASAEILSSSHIKDKYHVFFHHEIIPGANPQTFVTNLRKTHLDHDDKNIYSGSKNLGPITEEFRKKYIEK